jgi:acyl-CoA thioester hydrolase
VGYRHSVPVRYGEVDMQRVVFNAHYLAWVDDAMTRWMQAVGYRYESAGWDFMVRHADIDFRGSATFGDVVDIDCSVEHWGQTSFRVLFVLTVDGRAVVELRLTYAGVKPGTVEKAPVPDEFRALLGT